MLDEELSAVERGYLGGGYFQSLAEKHAPINENLRDGLTLREYQKDAIGRYLFYFDEYKNKKLPTHLLFNMATGSGKTVIMAAAILDLYQRGYRNFIFFTRLGNIVEKTKLNFLAADSSKYLFSNPLRFNGVNVQVNPVNNFDGASSNDINIMFTTTADLHYKLNNSMENSLTFEEMRTKKVVLIADEAHNLTADTRKKLSAEDEFNLTSWESTVMKLLNTNPVENVLLEFTATARLDSDYPEVLEKYRDKTLFRYDLKQYRLDGYSKDVNTFEVDTSLMQRVLVALVISQYRLKVAERHKLSIKPVVLLKANRVTVPAIKPGEQDSFDESIVVSSVFKENFHTFIHQLSAKDIEEVSRLDNEVLKKAFKFFESNGLTNAELSNELRRDFAETHCLTVDDGEALESKQVLLNTLEDPTNQVRAVFATQKLNEGWDVLNLFDIVRLYNSRDAAKNKAGKTTVEEAQLIGRGARYYPFDWEPGTQRMKRKFDSDTNHDLRILEELHYHSKTNPRYIQELKVALTDIGIIAERTVSRTLGIKPSVKSSKFWDEALLFMNSRERNLNEDIFSFQDAQVSFDPTTPSNIFALPTRQVRETAIFGNTVTSNHIEATEVANFPLSSLGSHVLRTALWDLPSGSFQSIKALFGGLKSLSEFLLSDEFLGGLSVVVTGTKSQLENLTQSEKREIARFVISRVLKAASHVGAEYVGSREFKPVLLKDVFAVDKTLKLEEGSERSRPVSEFELSMQEWFAQNEIWGTSEEKDFINFMKSSIAELESRFDNVMLLRNEMHFPIYSFSDGLAFYPDFVLFVKTKNAGDAVVFQVLIEPKGDQFLDSEASFKKSKESWKQEFLEEISDNAQIVIAGDKYKLIGLPFFNAGNTSPKMKERFREAFAHSLGLNQP